MALSGYIETGAYNASDGTRTIVLEWSATQSGAADNYSDVSWTLRGGGTSSQGINAKNIQAQIHTHATGLLWTTATRLYNGTVIASGKVRVPHNTDGTASFYLGISGYIYNYGTNYEKTASDTPTLDTINRMYYLDVNGKINTTPYGDTNIGGKFDVYINDELSANDCADFHSANGLFVYGTKYSIQNIRANNGYIYVGSEGNSISGTFDGNKSVCLLFYETHTITYDVTGGTNAPNDQIKTYGAEVHISDTIPTRVGYEFLNWNTQVDGRGTTYNPLDNYTPDQAGGIVTLYAQWKPNTYTITFDGNGGTTSIDSLEIAYETEQNNNINQYMPTRQAYEFLGWYTSPTNGVQVYDANGLCTNDGTYWKDNVCVYTNDYTLYAQWKVLNIVYYKHNGEWVLCYEYYKVNGIWYPCIRKRNFNGKFTYEIAVLLDEEDNILTDENGNIFVTID